MRDDLPFGGICAWGGGGGGGPVLNDEYIGWSSIAPGFAAPLAHWSLGTGLKPLIGMDLSIGENMIINLPI